MQGNAPDEEYEDPHGECRHEIGRLRTALEFISQLNDAKIEDAPPEILLELLRGKVATARSVLQQPQT